MDILNAIEVDSVYVNGQPLRIYEVATPDGRTGEVCWFGEGWHFTYLPTAQGFLDHCESRYRQVTGC